jgi:hypothetical protein
MIEINNAKIYTLTPSGCGRLSTINKLEHQMRRTHKLELIKTITTYEVLLLDY